MTRGLGFDTEKYLRAQKRGIEARLKKFSGRLYLEFGGKLMADWHAVRTLPGYEADAKLKLLKSLGKNLGILYCISAKQLVEGKIRGDWGLSYGSASIKALEELEKNGLSVLGVVINRFEGEVEAINFERRLRQRGVSVFKRREINGYPNDLGRILSKNGYGADDYIEIDKPLVVVWGAGPGSGKLSTCLGQIYNDSKRGIDSGYAKFETFPVWDLPLEHPVNIAYEAATADLGDYNLIDSFHLKKYKIKAVNYNRDIDAFPILSTIFKQITKKTNFSRSYGSPTDMGVNLLRKGMVNDKVIREASKREINFYLFRYREEYKKGLVDKKILERMVDIMDRSGVNETFLPTISAARETREEAVEQKGKGEGGITCGAALELPNGKIITGKNSPLLHAEAAVVLNAIKVLAGVPDSVELISPEVLKRIGVLKGELGEKSKSLECSEAVLALAVSSQLNPSARKVEKYLKKLRGCFMHTTHDPASADKSLFRKVGIWISTDGEVEKIR